jgi:hypothetical protein
MGWPWTAGLLGLVLAGPAAADVDSATVDLASLIECRADVKTYNGFAFWLTSEPDAAGKLGWQKAQTDNPFLEEYRLGSPVSAFGHATSNIAFTATGPMAILDDISPQDLAKSLDVPVAIATSGKFMAEKVIVDTREEEAGMRFSTYVTLNVSNVDTHPGKTLAGCSYRLEISTIE